MNIPQWRIYGRGVPGSTLPPRENKKKYYSMLNQYFTTGFLIIRPYSPPTQEITENTLVNIRMSYAINISINS